MESLVDILKTAIDNEIRARVYYAKAAEITEDGASQMVFLELTNMETGHAHLLVERFGPIFADADFDAMAYVEEKTGEAENVLTLEQSKVIERGDVREVLELAVRSEERARDTYTGLIERVMNEDQRALLRDLAGEEQKHRDLLSRTLVDLDIPPEERTPM